MRVMSEAMLAAIAANVARPVTFVDIGFAAGSLRVCDYARDLSWNAQTWIGNGLLHPMESAQETSDIQATGTTITLTALDTAVLSLILTEPTHYRGQMWFGLLNSSHQVIANPLLMFDGYVDSAEISDDESGGTIKVSLESDLVALERPNEFRHDNMSQQALFPGDKGFEYTLRTAEWSGHWGKAERPKWLRRKREKQK